MCILFTFDYNHNPRADRFSKWCTYKGNKSRGPANGRNGQFSRGLCWLEDSMTKQHVYDQGHPSNDSDEKKKRKWDTWISGYRSTFEPITDRILFTVKHHASLHSSSTNTISWCSPYVITWQYVQSLILRRLKVITLTKHTEFPYFWFH